MNIEGKISNQQPKHFSSTRKQITCSRCNKEMTRPRQTNISGLVYNETKTQFFIYNYLTATEDTRDYYIYPSNSGYSAIYCSKYCRDKHNHRFHSVIKEADVVKYSNFLLSMIDE